MVEKLWQHAGVFKQHIGKIKVVFGKKTLSDQLVPKISPYRNISYYVSVQRFGGIHAFMLHYFACSEMLSFLVAAAVAAADYVRIVFVRGFVQVFQMILQYAVVAVHKGQIFPLRQTDSLVSYASDSAVLLMKKLKAGISGIFFGYFRRIVGSAVVYHYYFVVLKSLRFYGIETALNVFFHFIYWNNNADRRDTVHFYVISFPFLSEDSFAGLVCLYCGKHYKKLPAIFDDLRFLYYKRKKCPKSYFSDEIHLF